MKKLQNVSIKIWILVALVISGAIIALIILLKMKIEKVYKTSIIVDKLGNSELVINPKMPYLLKKDNKVILKINNKNIETKIDTFRYDSKTKNFLVHLFNFKEELIPNSVLDAQLIYGQTTVINSLINPGV